VEKNFNFGSMNIKSTANLNATAHFGNTNIERKMQFDKTISGPIQMTANKKPHRSIMNKSGFNMFLQSINASQFTSKNIQNQHSNSKKQINSSAMFYYPQHTQMMNTFQSTKGIS